MASRILAALLFASLSVVLAQESKCTCIEGNGDYVYLRCPKGAPGDPSPCPATRPDGTHPRKPLPKAWNDMCFMSGRMSCFLRRHAASWQINCSQCAVKKCCPFPNHKNCPECHGDKAEAPPDHAEVLEFAADHKRRFGKRIEVAYSPNYVVISDIGSLKITTRAGAPRIASRHEILHLYLQRAELARRDFEKVFGACGGSRSAIVMVRSDNLRKKISLAYTGSAISVLRGGKHADGFALGYAMNGCFLSGKNDDNLHFRMRHLIGHMLITCYQSVQPNRKYCPHWMDAGCAHWLAKLHPRAKNFATFCQHEGAVSRSGGGRGRGGGGAGGGGGQPAGGGGGGPTVSGSGAKWDMKARKIARRGPKRDPVEAMFQAQTAKEMDFDMHVRSWSWFRIFTEDEPAKFVEFIQRLRRAEEPRVAVKTAWGQTPESVDDRWRERVIGKRKDTAANKREQKETDTGTASNRELDDIAREENLQILAGRIRGLEACRNIATARVLVALMDSRRSDRVRAVIELILGRTNDPEVLGYLRGKGYRKAGKLGRATICRMFGLQKHEAAAGLLTGALSDSFWLVRANAARSLAQVGHKPAIGRIAKMSVSDPVGKVRIGAMDALGLFGADAKATVPLFERNLMARGWQIKVATCETFRAIGNDYAVDMLIGRLDKEGGRIHDDILRALKDLTGMDRPTWSAQIWLKWWAKAKKFNKLEKKSRDELDKEGAKPSSTPKNRYATKKKPPTYYGIKVYARAVGYVLDVSASMAVGFRLSGSWQRRLGREYKGRTRMEVCKEELAFSIKDLDPRTRFNIVFFNDRVRTWQSAPVASGAMGAQGISAVKNVQPSGETNYYDALRAVLGQGDEAGGWNPAFADTPDTLFFLTDGQPTAGEITKADELLLWFRERNRFARLRVHVIAMGSSSIDHELLGKLARQNDGIYVHLTGTHSR